MSFLGTRKTALWLLFIFASSGATTRLAAQADAETTLADASSSLPAAPSSQISPHNDSKLLYVPPLDPTTVGFSGLTLAAQSKTGLNKHGEEPYHWKGLLLQSFALDMLQNSVRIMTADQNDRHLLLNKPFWSDYWASLGQFNMRRWNDGDSIPVNYIWHPIEGAIAGYIEIQNDPRGRNLRMGDGKAYWKSRERAFWWSLVFSTQWEIGPFGETAIFNQGGFTYPIQCNKHPGTPNYCELPTSKYTNNTGWVDFIITPIVGSLWILGEDAIDRYVTDPLVQHHHGNFGIDLVRSGLNPPRSMANILRGHFPWWRDYEHPGQYDSIMVQQFTRITEEETEDHADLFLHYTNLGLGTYTPTCNNCRRSTDGFGAEIDVPVRRYIEFMTDVSVQPHASPLSGLNAGGSLLTAVFGLRSGYSGRWGAVGVSLAPGFASWSHAISAPSPEDPNPSPARQFNFATTAALSAELRPTRQLAFRISVENTLIRYRSPFRDPPGIGSPPRLSFLSHDNYINSTNWGMNVGPVLRF
jgi:hypothetical protein